MPEKNGKTRRTMVKMLAGGLGITAGTGAVSAASGRSYDTPEVELRDGRLALSGSRYSVSSVGTVDDLDLTATNPRQNGYQATDRVFAAGLATINEAADRGLVRLGEVNGEVQVRPTDAAVPGSQSVSSMGDGKNGYEVETTLTQVTHELHVDAEKSEELAEMAAAGALVSGIASALLAYSGVGSLAAPVSAVLAALLGYAGAQYATEAGNNGTITKLHMLYTGTPYGQIDSQDEDNEGFPYV